MTFNPYRAVKNYKEYTENEILDLIENEKNPFLYDIIIDRLYFYTENKRNTKNTSKYNILTALNLYKREHNEKKINFNYYSN